MMREFMPRSITEPERTDPLPDALCQKLPTPQAIDRYFFPDERDSIEAHFGRAICRRCPEIVGCWEGALTNPPEEGIRAGQDARTIRAIRDAMIDATGYASVDLLPDELLYPDHEPLEVRHGLNRQERIRPLRLVRAEEVV